LGAYAQGPSGGEDEGDGGHARDDQAMEGERTRSWLEEVAQMSEVVREYTEIWHGVLFLMGLEHLRGALQDVGVHEHCTIRFVRERQASSNGQS
jgi:hypothetical protein